jgi:hypothetical protein
MAPLKLPEADNNTMLAAAAAAKAHQRWMSYPSKTSCVQNRLTARSGMQPDLVSPGE